MYDALGNIFLDDRNGLGEARFRLIGRVIGHGIPDFLYGFFGSCLITLISHSFNFVLPGPFQG